MNERQKTQGIRLLDVYFIGPAMTYAGWRLSRRGEGGLGGLLAFMGVLTVIYNGNNYLLNREQRP